MQGNYSINFNFTHNLVTIIHYFIDADIDDSDPLDDILLSDEEPPDPKNSIKNKSFIFQ